MRPRGYGLRTQLSVSAISMPRSTTSKTSTLIELNEWESSAQRRPLGRVQSDRR